MKPLFAPSRFGTVVMIYALTLFAIGFLSSFLPVGIFREIVQSTTAFVASLGAGLVIGRDLKSPAPWLSRAVFSVAATVVSLGVLSALLMFLIWGSGGSIDPEMRQTILFGLPVVVVLGSGCLFYGLRLGLRYQGARA